MKPTTTTIASTLLAAGIALAAPGLALAQQAPGDPAAMQNDQTTGGDATRALFIRAAGRLDAMTTALATLTNHIPQRNIVPVAVDRFSLTDSERATLTASMTPDRRSALRDAMDKATVSTEDRPNGTDEDQNSLTDYVKHLGIDPRGVLAVDVNTRHDADNPVVTIFYRRGALHGQQQGGPG